MQPFVSDAKYIRVLEELNANKNDEIIRLTGRIQSLHADLDLFAKEKSILEEKLIDAFMAGAEWLEEFRTGKRLEWWADRQKAMGYALEKQTQLINRSTAASKRID